MKIKENERVHMEMFELKSAFESEKDKISKELEDQRKKTQELVDECVRKDSSLKRLMQDKENVLCQKDKLSLKLKTAISNASIAHQQMILMNEELNTELNYQRDRFNEKILFDDAKNESLNAWNVPPCNSLDAQQLFKSAKQLVGVFVSCNNIILNLILQYYLYYYYTSIFLCLLYIL